MKVWELMSWLAELPAGADVYLQPGMDNGESYDIVSVTDSTEEDTGTNVTVWINGNKPLAIRPQVESDATQQIHAIANNLAKVREAMIAQGIVVPTEMLAELAEACTEMRLAVDAMR